MLSYRVILDVPLPLVVFVSRLLAAHRREIGTRNGTRALTCWKQAVFALAWFRDRPDIRRLGAGFGISQATAYRYKDEAVEVLAAKAPTLRETLDKAIDQGLPYLILDGTLISSDRCADKKTSRKGKEIDKWYSGKAHEPAGNVQALAGLARCYVGTGNIELFSKMTGQDFHVEGPVGQFALGRGVTPATSG